VSPTNTAEDVLARCRAAGVLVRVDGSDLMLTPSERVTPELVAAVRAFKPRILAELTWDEDEADRTLDACLDRLGRACTHIDGFDTDQERADLEERITLAAIRRDRAGFAAALAGYEGHCLTRYGHAPER
jgi:hypothetical protein